MKLGQRFLNKGSYRGFSLVEMLISVLIFTIVIGIIYSYLLRTKQNVKTSEQELEAADNAQAALQALREDLYQIGLGADPEHNQPKLLRCTPYDIMFVADLDRNSVNQSDRYGAYVNSLPNASTGNFFPILQYVNSPGDWGWDPTVDYGSKTVGAEIVRYSLDYNGDYRINSQDTEDAIALSDPDLTHNQNPADFWLIKEWWGCRADPHGGGFKNEYSGIHPVAFNIRGTIYDPLSPSSAIPPEFQYPTKKYPQPLFTYWGHFVNTVTAHDDPGDDDWEGEPLDLWGDWGGGNPPAPYPSGFSSTATGDINNGKLSQAEINFLISQSNSGVSWGIVRVLYPETPGTDYNGDGISNETRLDQVIRRIGITVTTEAGTPDRQHPNTEYSDFSTTPPKIYPFKDYQVSIVLDPDQLRLEGAPILQVVPSTPTPIPYTFTPTPSGPTPPPTFTPTPLPSTTYTFTPAPSPTPTPGAIDYNNDEIFFGAKDGIVGLWLEKTNNPTDLCDAPPHPFYFYSYPGKNIIDMEAVNFCFAPHEGPFNPDPWNDLVFATDATSGDNLFYLQHQPYLSVDGLKQPAKSIRIGNLNQKIVAIAAGNVNPEILTPADIYPEIFVAYYDPYARESYITFVSVGSNCGNFNDPVCAPYHVHGQITDMIATDMDDDGLAELAVVISDSSGISPAVIVFDDIYNCFTDTWVVAYEGPSIMTPMDYVVKLDYGNILSGSDSFPDIVLLTDQGELIILPNISSGTPPVLAFDDPPCMPLAGSGHAYGKDIICYSSPITPFDLTATLSSDNNYLLNIYRSGGACGSIIPVNSCSGDLNPSVTYSPIAIDFFDLDGATITIPTLAFILHSGFSYHAYLMGSPCIGTTYPDDVCELDLPGLRYNCMASTRNAHSSDPAVMPKAKSSSGKSGSSNSDQSVNKRKLKPAGKKHIAPEVGARSSTLRIGASTKREKPGFQKSSVKNK